MSSAKSVPNFEQKTPTADEYIPGAEFNTNSSPGSDTEFDSAAVSEVAVTTPPVLILATPTPAKPKFGTLFWLSHILGLDIYGTATLSYSARVEMNAAALILSSIFLFDLAAWGLLFYFIFNSGSLEFHPLRLGLALLAFLPSFPLLLYERGFMIADTRTDGWKKLRGPTYLRLGIILIAALITSQPVELKVFEQRITARIQEELVRKDIVSHHRKLQEAKEKQNRVGASVALAPRDNRKLDEAEQDLKDSQSRLASAEFDLPQRLQYQQAAFVQLQTAKNNLTKSRVTPELDPTTYRRLSDEVERAKSSYAQRSLAVAEQQKLINGLKIAMKQTQNDIPSLRAAVDRDESAKIGQSDETKLDVWADELRGAEPGQNFTGPVTGYQFKFVEYDFLDKFRVLSDILSGRPPRWPGANEKMAVELKQHYGMFDETDDSSPGGQGRVAAEISNARRAYIAVFGIAVMVPLLSLLFKLIMPAQLSYYYANAWQSKQCHPEAMAHEAAVFSMRENERGRRVIELPKSGSFAGS